MVLAGTALEESRLSSHVVVPLSSVSHASMVGSIPVAIGQHRSLRSIGATSLCTSVEAHVPTVSLSVYHVSTMLVQFSCVC